MNIREFKTALTELINNSGLPLDVMELILESVFNAVHRKVEEYYTQVNQEEVKDE